MLKPLEPVEFEEGEEIQVIIKRGDSIAKRFYGIAKKHRPELTSEEFLEVIEE